MLMPENLQNLSNQISLPPTGQPVLPVAVETQVDAHLHKIDSFFLYNLGSTKKSFTLSLIARRALATAFVSGSELASDPLYVSCERDVYKNNKHFSR